jgi:hypothetical protein
MALCVNAKQHSQAQAEAKYNISILCYIYGLEGVLWKLNVKTIFYLSAILPSWASITN